ncbi:MAG: Choline-sulfatase [uncultured Chloroflexi bacterium]|uniref:Choline-sulfatase n=1 Tax=uncultured Chloroflexota bacterium TaxID=166587 RepID=A0A6J4HSI0_9CHLR|nr:MAG: Choline-sulfatase [uncultured Chloroflexota bacterium]
MSANQPRRPNRPHVVLITTDQQRFNTTGPAAPPWLRTPHLDHLAREGVSFSRAYADCPVCIPSRISIMTGTQGFTHGMLGNGKLPDGTLPIDPARSLPARMRSLGYQTVGVGKMHFEPQRARYGFEELILPDDYYHWMRTQGVSLGAGRPMDHGLGQNELYPGMATVPESYTLTAWTVDQCVDYVKRRRDPTRPLFMWCSFSKPHPPLDPPEPYYSMYRHNPDCPLPEPWRSEWSVPGTDSVPEAFRRFRESWSLDQLPLEVLREARAAYYGLITQIDYNMGRLFAGFQDLGEFNDTVFLFTSDHGELLGDHHSGGKSYWYEGSAHVPFILRLPPTFRDRRAGVTVDSPVCLADVYTTCIAAAGGDLPSEGGATTTRALDGRDLVSLALSASSGDAGSAGSGDPASSRTTAALGRDWLEGACGRPEPQWHGLTDGRWKYVYYFGDGREQLFDLQSDPHELTELVAAEAAHSQLEECRSVLAARFAERGSDLVRDGKFAVLGLPDETEAARRARPWPGYHTTEFHVDVRH